MLHDIRDAGLAVAASVTPRSRSAGDSILVLQPDHLGDILLSQPAVRLLRERLPEARLIAVVGPWSAEITRRAWPADDVVEVEFPGFGRSSHDGPAAPYQLLPSAAKVLRALQPAVAVVLRPDAWWAAWLARLAVAEVITSDSVPTCRFATHAIRIANDEHAAVRAARIASGLAGGALPTRATTPLSVPRDAAAHDDVAALLRSSGITGPYAVIHPGSGAAVKLWSTARWRSVARWLESRGFAIVLTGGAGERELCAEVAQSNTAVSIAGETDLSALLEVMRGATVAVGTDSGPMHLAVAAGTPTVHLFGPSDPRRYGPWGDPRRHRVVSAGWSCPRCGDLGADRQAGCGCMLAITPESVLREIDALLEDHGPG